MRILIILLLFGSKLYAQDLFDKEHSYTYAKHLVCEGQFRQAQEALVSPIGSGQTDSLFCLYIHCLSQLNEREKLFFYLQNALNKDSISDQVLHQLACLCLKYDSLHLLEKSWKKLPTELQLRYLLLTDNIELLDATILKNKHTIDSNYFYTLRNQLKTIKKPLNIKPVIAAIFIPGSGKMWIGNTYEGFLQLLMVTTHTYLSVYSFNNYGARSIFGFTNLFMGTVFYGGNIWGTYYSLKRKKAFEIQHLKNEINANLYSSYYRISCE